MIDKIFPVDDVLLERMAREIKDLEGKVSSVLTLSAMEDLDYDVRLEKIDALDFIDEVVSSTSLGKRVLLDVRISSFMGDKRLLMPACCELLKNAGKYSIEQSVITWRLFPSEDKRRSIVMEFEN